MLARLRNREAFFFQEYEMQEENPYLNVEDPLEEGKRLWSIGDLANAILHFEAAIHKDSNSSEVRFLYCVWFDVQFRNL